MEDVTLLLIFLVLNLSFVSAIGERYELKVTNEHPFLIGGKWIPASELNMGDLMFTIDGRLARITNIKDVFVENSVDVYNLETGGFYNFVVNGGVVVHNSDEVNPSECRFVQDPNEPGTFIPDPIL